MKSATLCHVHGCKCIHYFQLALAAAAYNAHASTCSAAASLPLWFIPEHQSDMSAFRMTPAVDSNILFRHDDSRYLISEHPDLDTYDLHCLTLEAHTAAYTMASSTMTSLVTFLILAMTVQTVVVSGTACRYTCHQRPYPSLLSGVRIASVSTRLFKLCLCDALPGGHRVRLGPPLHVILLLPQARQMQPTLFPRAVLPAASPQVLIARPPRRLKTSTSSNEINPSCQDCGSGSSADPAKACGFKVRYLRYHHRLRLANIVHANSSHGALLAGHHRPRLTGH